MNEKFENYVKILLETVTWKKPDSVAPVLDFLNDIDKIAQNYGYKAKGFGEHEEKRIIMFEKIK
jgi:hypothetical protein